MRTEFLVYPRQKRNKCNFCKKLTTRINKSKKDTKNGQILSFLISFIPFDD